MPTLAKKMDPAQYILNRLILLSLPLLILGYFEYLSRGQIYNPLWWLVSYPLPVVLNYLLVLTLLLLFTAIVGRTWAAHVISSLILISIGATSGIKMKTLGTPLMPGDVTVNKESMAMALHLSDVFEWKILFLSLFFVLCSFLLLRLALRFDVKYFLYERIFFLAYAIFFACCIYFDKPLNINSTFNISNIFWDQRENYKINGFLAATSNNLKLARIEVPANYTEEYVNALIRAAPRRTNIDAATSPNIIIVLSEALWDPTLLPKAIFDRDPLPNLHELMRNYSSGAMLSPEFGGGTANVEFEVLSGNSMRFVPPGSIAYTQYVNRSIESLASILARQGYATTAISPVDNWFYNSKNVYNYLGFSQFISAEFFEKNLKGPYISDSEVSKNIITQTKRTAGPDFIFANTMENHFPFGPGKFKENVFKVSGAVTDTTRGMLETYATGIADADLMLKFLVDHYSKSTEPTIIAFFGDHKPILGLNYGVYRETAYLKENDPEQLRKMHEVPVVVWNNYLPAHKDNLDISPSFLGPYILNLAKKEGSPYMDHLYFLSRNIPVIPPSFYYEEFNIKVGSLETYKLMQYDMMFGKQYAMQQMKLPVARPGFELGFGKMLIDKISPDVVAPGMPNKKRDQVTLTLSGQNFGPSSQVYFNDRPVETQLLADDRLKATVPNVAYQAGEDVLIKVKVVDSRNIVIADSNIVTIKGNRANEKRASTKLTL